MLTLAAGAASAVGFLSLGGVFTSVVTVNSTLLDLHLATPTSSPPTTAAYGH
ncbi:DUF1275 family protein [Streptomyces sp. S.PB5]|uniref:DUF1275 family protein n=1 Tax=Streptomyces sp. S.PB5 TaxID=3020844 RepID=UPI0025AF0685|nr:DUF1275 family protein [Streptomyces sp. S.PB5]MDN3027048.1 DUF1275 family protein [Streptomyces sp. S.PB5]